MKTTIVGNPAPCINLSIAAATIERRARARRE